MPVVRSTERDVRHVRHAGQSEERMGTYAVADGSMVEVEAVDADEGTLQDIVDDPEPGTEGRANATPAAGR